MMDFDSPRPDLGPRRRPTWIPVVALLLAVAGAPGPGSSPFAAPSPEADGVAALRALVQDARWSEAESAARALVAQRAGADGETSPAWAAAADLLVEVLVRSGRWSDPEARALAARALDAREKALGPDAPEVASSLIRIGSIERLTGPMDHARAVLERALAIRQAAFGADSLPVAEALWQLGWACNDTNDAPRAIALHEQALAIRERALGKDDLLVAESLTGLGGVVRNAGDFHRAAELHERALEIRRRHLRPDHPDIAQSLLGVGEAKHSAGDLAGALPLYEAALALREGASTPDLPRLSEVLIDLAGLLTELADYERARAYYERGLKIRVDTMGEDNYITGEGHRFYALFLEAIGDDVGARRELESAIATYDRVLSPPHPLRAVARQDLGVLLRRQGDLASARSTLQAAVDIWRMRQGPGHPFSATALMALGGVLRDLGEIDSARPLLDQAIEILGASYGPEHPLYGEALLERARLKWRVGSDAAALEDALRAEESLRANLRATSRGLSEAEALRYQEVMLSGLDIAFSIVARSSPPAPVAARRAAVFEALARSRAVVLDEIAARHRGVTRSDDPAVRRLDEALQAARRRYARLVVEGPSPRNPGPYAALLRGAREGTERAERDLAAASRSFADERGRRTPTFQMIAKSLPAGAALVSYVAYRRAEPAAAGEGSPAFLAFVVRSGAGAPDVVPIGAAAEVEVAVEEWRREASGPPAGPAALESYRAAASRVREMVWDPVARHLGGASRVLVVPDGALHMLSFATLVDRHGQFLLESGPEIHYVSAERDLAGGGAASRGRGLLALGGPDFDASPADLTASGAAAAKTEGDGAGHGPRLRGAESSPCADLATLRFSPLPGAEAEVRQVQALWSARAAGSAGAGRGGDAVQVLTGRQATESNLERAAAGKRVIHLATHAFFVPSRCDERITSGAVAGGGAGATGGRLEAGTPLRVSGLALSGANRKSAASSDDDGLLTGEEISSLDLDGVEWVVLSGCQTGAGLARAGEGILGLRRSFQVAGARTLILSLWPVSDNDTQSWMAELYRARAGGATTSAAVKAASRRIVEARRKAGVTTHPFFWGAFVAAGDWR
jgi:CHAT domain-containing protein